MGVRGVDPETTGGAPAGGWRWDQAGGGVGNVLRGLGGASWQGVSRVLRGCERTGGGVRGMLKGLGGAGARRGRPTRGSADAWAPP